MPFPEIPDELTSEYWQNNKGRIAKMSGYTGISDAMDAVARAYDQIDRSLFNEGTAAGLVMNGGGIEVFDEWFAKAKAEYPKVVELRQKVYQLRDLANQTAERFTGIFVRGTHTLLGDIAVAAEHFAVALRSMGDVWEHKRQELIRLLDDWRRQIGDILHNIQQEAASFVVAPDPKAAQLKAAFYQKCRTLVINIRSQPDLRPQLYAIWRPVSQDAWYEIENGEPVRQKARELQGLSAQALVVLAAH